MSKRILVAWILFFISGTTVFAEDFPKPYSAPCVERENIFAFTEKPAIKLISKDYYEITFAVEANCDVTVGLIDEKGVIVRHIGSGVLGSNAPEPFQKNSLKQKLYWKGKDDLLTYVPNPEKLKLKVSLGLSPVFHNSIGGNPFNMPGYPLGIGADKDGVYVFSKSHRSRPFIRRFSHDMEYLATLSPPPANLPESKLQGMGYVEYEKGKRALHSPDIYDTIVEHGIYLPKPLRGGLPAFFRPAIVGGRVYYGSQPNPRPAYLYHIYTDGSTDLLGTVGRPLKPLGNKKNSRLYVPHIAASPDGKWVYMVDAGKGSTDHVVWRISANQGKEGKPFIGKLNKGGTDNESLSGPSDVTCDAKGQIYVCDKFNQRVQIFSQEGAYLKTLKVSSPNWLAVHQKTGEIYIMHEARVDGKSRSRLTKYSPYPNMKKLFHFDGIVYEGAVLDSWSTPTRIWTCGGVKAGKKFRGKSYDNVQSARVWEEKKNSFEMILDFDKKAQEDLGSNYDGRWSGSIRSRVVCDPSREDVYLRPAYHTLGSQGSLRYDLPTGKLIEVVASPGFIDDMAFDKHGYMHAHFNPSFYQGGVGRYNPDAKESLAEPSINGFKLPKTNFVRFKEVPYDYGIAGRGGQHSGILDVADQGGSKFFQDGFGVNMRGDVAEQCNIYYAPKMGDLSKDAWEGPQDKIAARARQPGVYRPKYGDFLKEMAALEKKGIQTRFIARAPGVYLTGGTIWTFDGTGEVRDEFAVTAGRLVNGVQIDEDGDLYFAVSRPRLYNRKTFLSGRGGILGGKSGVDPWMCTYIKSGSKNVKILTEKKLSAAPLQLENKPNRPVEVGGGGIKNGVSTENCWVEGAKWLYAGASPVVPAQPCSCPTLRPGLDWYKRSYVPEAYRHSIGILDSNGNLILHMGEYGNLDSAHGAKSKIPLGGANIAISFTEFVSATDNYICYDDNGERISVVKIAYKVEEEVSLP